MEFHKHLGLRCRKSLDKFRWVLLIYPLRFAFAGQGKRHSLPAPAQNYRRAMSGVSRRDHFKDKCENIHGVKADREAKQAKVLKESTQTPVVGLVLVATATFGAPFAMPGG